MNELFPRSNEIVELAHHLGNHPARLALWREGAVAMRLPQDRMLISAAGVTLNQLSANQLLEIDLPKARELVASDTATDEELASAIITQEGPAPSSDAFTLAGLFAFEGINFIAHTQPIEVNQIVCSPRARQFADRRYLPHEIAMCGQASVLVPFAPPGIELAREVRRRIALWQDRYKETPKVILLQNHGVITVGETAHEVIMLTEMVVKFAEIFLGASLLGGPEFMKPTYVSRIASGSTI